MSRYKPEFLFESARIRISVTCPDCQAECSTLIQGHVTLPRESGVPVIGFTPCIRCKQTGRIELEIPLEQFRHLLTPPPPPADDEGP